MSNHRLHEKHLYMVREHGADLWETRAHHIFEKAEKVAREYAIELAENAEIKSHNRTYCIELIGPDGVMTEMFIVNWIVTISVKQYDEE